MPEWSPQLMLKAENLSISTSESNFFSWQNKVDALVTWPLASHKSLVDNYCVLIRVAAAAFARPTVCSLKDHIAVVSELLVRSTDWNYQKG